MKHVAPDLIETILYRLYEPGASNKFVKFIMSLNC